MNQNPTEEFYQLLNQAYSHFNLFLFDEQLPWCMLTLQRSSNTMGYFSAERWVDGVGTKAHEIALNPAYFARHKVIDILQTLVHEQCHLWQHLYGLHKSRSGYHNREWADKMQSVGLIPSDTGEPGGRETGQTMSDYPKTGGEFLKACYALSDMNYDFKWIDTEPAWQETSQPRVKQITTSPTVETYIEEILEVAPTLLSPIPTKNVQPAINWSVPAKAKRLSKSKYSCPQCSIAVWGKPLLNIVCGDCNQQLVLSSDVK